jgi:hypothetical protein
MGSRVDRMLSGETAGLPTAIQVLLAAIVAMVVGSLGLLFILPDSTGLAQQIVWHMVVFFMSGFAIGFFFPRAWYVSVLVAWVAELVVVSYAAIALVRACV